MAAPVVSLRCLGEEAEEDDAVGVVTEEGLAIYGEAGHVVDPVRQKPAKRSSHNLTVGRRCAGFPGPRRIATLLRSFCRESRGHAGQ